MPRGRRYDLFVTHAWRYHEDWARLVELLDGAPGLGWRNFSVPWYDPALDVRTESGGAAVRGLLEGQIAPVHAVILLDGVHRAGSARKWIDLELAFARRLRKPIVAVPPLDCGPVSAEALAAADAVAPWDAAALLAAVDRLLPVPASP